MIPPGGYHWKETHNGATIELRSESLDTLADVLLKYRLANGIPVGDPLNEIADHICGQWPHFCSGNEPAVQRKPLSQKAHHPSRRASDWVARLFRLGAQKSVKETEAYRRAERCVNCPANVDYRVGGCSSCVSSLEKLAFVWLRGRSTSLDSKLGVCRHTGQLNSCAVQADTRPPLETETKLEANCWMK